MYIDSASRNPLDHESKIVRRPTVADVLGRLAARTNLAKSRRDALSSALRRGCEILGEEPASVDAEPCALRRRLRALGPVVVGLSPGGWRNLRSLAIIALSEAGIAIVPTRSTTPLSPEWQGLKNKLPPIGSPRAPPRLLPRGRRDTNPPPPRARA